jgi:CubicO group peptidase (beta-lactamase class C family)
MSETRVHPAVQEIRDSLAPLIEAAQERFQIPGISLVLVRGRDVLWTEGFGHADQTQGTEATPYTVYRAGSLAKPFTAIAVMQLAEAGEIDIDQPINAYLPEFSIRSRFDTIAKPITVRSTLCHHSGLPTDLNKGMWSREPFTQVAEKLREEYAAFPPNLVFSYSNVGYTLLGHMVERTARIPYAEYMEQRIFDRIGMRQSGIGRSRGGAHTLAKGYRGGKALYPLPIRDLPAFGLYTSAADLGVFLRTLLRAGAMAGNRLLAPETLEEMFEPQNRHVQLDLDILNGLGWFLEEGGFPGGGPVIRHGGTTLAFGSELILLPETGLGMAVLANADGSRPIVSRLAEEILNRVLDSNPPSLSAGLFLEELEREAQQPELGELAGKYATDFGLISIRPKDGKLCACIVEETFDLIPYPHGWFGIDRGKLASLPTSIRPLAHMRFQTRYIDGKEVVVARKGDKHVLLGEKIPAEPVPEVWLRRVGDYELVNPDRHFPLEEPRLKMREGQLCMSYKMPRLSSKTIQVPLRAISDDEAVILGLGRTRGETLRAITVDGEEHLRYSGFIGRKLADGHETEPWP